MHLASRPDGHQRSIVIQARLVEGDLPADPDDPHWAAIPYVNVPLSGQVLARPRLQTPSVDEITVRALYNGREVAIHLEWNDRIKNVTHDQPNRVGEFDARTTYPRLYDPARPRQIFRDAAAVQFPVKIPEGPEKPHFFNGSLGKPVNIWYWKADVNEEPSKGFPMEEQNAAGFKNPVVIQPPESQAVQGKGVFKNGQWKVVMIRSFTTHDQVNDIQFEAGKFIPIAFSVWDGANREEGLQKSLSSWYYIFLEAPTPTKVYFYGLLGLLVGLVLEGWGLWSVRKRESSTRSSTHSS